jgi:hypothetical protein
MFRISFLAALFSAAGITSVLATPMIPPTWICDIAWIVIAVGCVVAVMASEGASA